jgi:hypothetical protein
MNNFPHQYTSGKFTTGVNDTSGKFAAMSTNPVKNLPPVSITPAVNFATADKT